MVVVRPIARDDLPAVLALSERTGTGLTTLPADRDRLAQRIERSLASFAGTALRQDECYMFVLVEGRNAMRVTGISAIEAAIGLAAPWYNYRVHTLVHASQALGVYTAVPTLFLANDHTGPHRARFAVRRPEVPPRPERPADREKPVAVHRGVRAASSRRR